MKNETKFAYSKKIEFAINHTIYKKNNEPHNPIYPHIEKLLVSIKKIIKQNIKTVYKENVGNDLGMLVIRRIDDEDPVYASILIEISDNFETDFVINSS